MYDGFSCSSDDILHPDFLHPVRDILKIRMLLQCFSSRKVRLPSICLVDRTNNIKSAYL